MALRAKPKRSDAGRAATGEPALSYTRLYSFFCIKDSVPAAELFATEDHVKSFDDAIQQSLPDLPEIQRATLDSAPRYWKIVAEAWESLTAADQEAIRGGWMVDFSFPVVIRS